MKILKSKKRYFAQKLKTLDKFKIIAIESFKKQKLENFSSKITSKIPNILLTKISKKINFKIQDHFQTSDYLLNHLYYIQNDLVNIPKKKNQNKINLENALIALELLNLTKLIYSWIEDSNINLIIQDSKIIQVMDIILSISAHFAIEVGSFRFNQEYSQSCQEASVFLFQAYNNIGREEDVLLDQFWQVKKFLMFFYEYSYVLNEGHREIIEDIANKISVDIFNKTFESNIFNLKNKFFKNNISMNIRNSITKKDFFVKNSKLDLKSEIKTLSHILIN